MRPFGDDLPIEIEAHRIKRGVMFQICGTEQLFSGVSPSGQAVGNAPTLGRK